MGLDIHVYAEKRNSREWVYFIPTPEERHMRCHTCGNLPDIINHEIFWRMAALHPDRNWPTDVSSGIMEAYNMWKCGGGAHSATYFTLEEMITMVSNMHFEEGNLTKLNGDPDASDTTRGKYLFLLGYLCHEGRPKDVRFLVFFE